MLVRLPFFVPHDLLMDKVNINEASVMEIIWVVS